MPWELLWGVGNPSLGRKLADGIMDVGDDGSTYEYELGASEVTSDVRCGNERNGSYSHAALTKRHFAVTQPPLAQPIAGLERTPTCCRRFYALPVDL